MGERLETKQLWNLLNITNLNNVKTMLLLKQVRGGGGKTYANANFIVYSMDSKSKRNDFNLIIFRLQ